jgi:hypothetical protein
MLPRPGGVTGPASCSVCGSASLDMQPGGCLI